MKPQTLNPYVHCLNNPMKYIDPDGQLGHEAAEWNFDSLYLTWQDMWDASHSDDRNDHWDPDKAPPKREHRRSEIRDFPDSWGFEFTGSYALGLGEGGGIGFVFEKWNIRMYGISQVGGGGSASVDASFFISSSRGKDVANSEAEGAEGSAGLFYCGGSKTLGKEYEYLDVDKFNIGLSVSKLPAGGAYWAYVQTSEIGSLRGFLSWLKEKIF